MKTTPRTIDTRQDTTKDPVGTEVPEEWKGHFVGKGTGYPVYRGPRVNPPKRLEVGNAVFWEEEPSEEWREYQNRQADLHNTDCESPNFYWGLG